VTSFAAGGGARGRAIRFREARGRRGTCGPRARRRGLWSKRIAERVHERAPLVGRDALERGFEVLENPPRSTSSRSVLARRSPPPRERKASSSVARRARVARLARIARRATTAGRTSSLPMGASRGRCRRRCRAGSSAGRACLWVWRRGRRSHRRAVAAERTASARARDVELHRQRNRAGARRGPGATPLRRAFARGAQ
jgi:hypothetical protein